MPAIPQKRGVSRVRYERMVRESLAAHNAKVQAENLEIAWWNTEFSTRKKDKSGSGMKKPKHFMTEHDAFHSRKKECSRLRFRIFRELHDAGYSYPSIGAVGHFDHTTILSGVRKINTLEPLPILIAEVAEGAAVHAQPYDCVSVTQGTERTTRLDEALALIEVRPMTIAA